MDGSPGSCKSLSFIQVASLEDHGASWSIGLAVNICHFYLAHGSIANSINLTAAGFHLIGIRQAAFIYFHGVNYTKSPRALPQLSMLSACAICRRGQVNNAWPTGAAGIRHRLGGSAQSIAPRTRA